MNTNKYTVSSLLLLALVFSFGAIASKVSAETNSAPSVSTSGYGGVDTDNSGKKVDSKGEKEMKERDTKPSMIETGTAKFSSEAEFDAALKKGLEECRLKLANQAVNQTKIGACEKQVREKFQIKKMVKPTTAVSSKEEDRTKSSSGGREMEARGKQEINDDRRENTIENKGEHFRRLFVRFNAYHTKLSKIADLLTSRIEKLDAAKIETAEAKRHVSIARAHLKDARVSIDLAMKLWQQIRDKNLATDTDSDDVTDDDSKDDDSKSDSGGNSSDVATKNIYAPVKETLEKAKKSLNSAKHELAEALRTMRKDIVNSTVSPLDANKKTPIEVQ